jgi:esterase/lipase superfamily enzyme
MSQCCRFAVVGRLIPLIPRAHVATKPVWLCHSGVMTFGFLKSEVQPVTMPAPSSPLLTRRAALASATAALGSLMSGCLGIDGGLGSSFTAKAASRSGLRDEPSLLVMTTRKMAPEKSAVKGVDSPFFTADRGKGLIFAKAELAPPSDSNFASRMASGESASWSVQRLQRLVSQGAASAMAQAASGRDVLIYVHGYNETFETAASGAANLADGINFQGQSALFAWPSGGGLIAYAYDRESALWSRDGFMDMLKALSANPAVGRVHIVAHSMGAFLTLESLRQLKTGAGDAAIGKIGAVVMASPDIDIDQFESAVTRLPGLAERITVISATNDRALAVSARIAGGVSRAGSSERSRLEALGVRVADASDHGWGLVRHDLFLSNEDVRSVIARAISRAA